MGEIIYWKEFDEPKKYINKISGREEQIPGEYVCTDYRVEKFVIWGYFKSPPSHEMGLAAGLFMKDGERKEFYPAKNEFNKSNPAPEKWDEELISQAEQYLQSLK